jgi:hypothetical protein
MWRRRLPQIPPQILPQTRESSRIGRCQRRHPNSTSGNPLPQALLPVADDIIQSRGAPVRSRPRSIPGRRWCDLNPLQEALQEPAILHNQPQRREMSVATTSPFTPTRRRRRFAARFRWPAGRFALDRAARAARHHGASSA